jgi:hypothetical protein
VISWVLYLLGGFERQECAQPSIPIILGPLPQPANKGQFSTKKQAREAREALSVLRDSSMFGKPPSSSRYLPIQVPGSPFETRARDGARDVLMRRDGSRCLRRGERQRTINTPRSEGLRDMYVMGRAGQCAHSCNVTQPAQPSPARIERCACLGQPLAGHRAIHICPAL